MGRAPVILLDTHVRFWWAQGDSRLSLHHARVLNEALETQTIAVSAFSCWEVAMMVSRQRVEISVPVLDWILDALEPSGVSLLPITPEIAAQSVALPGDLHGDPADRIIIATARVHSALLLTEDAKILAYPHVQTN